MKNKQIRILLILDQVYDNELYDYFANINPRNRATQIRLFLKYGFPNNRSISSNSEAQNQFPKTTLKLVINEEMPESNEGQDNPKVDVAKEIPEVKVAKEESPALKYLGEHMDDLLNSINTKK